VAETEEPTHRCPTCGAEVTLVSVDEETSWYLPVKQGADGDATNMAVAIRFALRHLPDPWDEPDQMRAAGIGALRGALDAHDRRIAG
jgi:hypothetical protein